MRNHTLMYTYIALHMHAFESSNLPRLCCHKTLLLANGPNLVDSQKACRLKQETVLSVIEWHLPKVKRLMVNASQEKRQNMGIGNRVYVCSLATFAVSCICHNSQLKLTKSVAEKHDRRWPHKWKRAKLYITKWRIITCSKSKEFDGPVRSA